MRAARKVTRSMCPLGKEYGDELWAKGRSGMLREAPPAGRDAG